VAKRGKKAQVATSYKRYHIWAQGCNKEIIFNEKLILVQFIFSLSLQPSTHGLHFKQAPPAIYIGMAEPRSCGLPLYKYEWS
jgi:hypothetical protein